MRSRTVAAAFFVLCLAWSPCGAQELPFGTRVPEARAHFGRALDLIDRFRTYEAEAALERALDADPTFAAAYALLALLQPFDAESGVRLAETAVRLAPDTTSVPGKLAAAVLAAETGESERAVMVAESLRAAYPEPWLTTYLLAHIHFLKRSDYAAAERVLAEGVELHPGSALLRNLLGYATWSQGRADEALTIFEENVRRHPDQPNPYDSAANLYTSLGRIEEAVAHYERSIDIDPDLRFGRFFTPRRVKLADVYVELGRDDAAERVLREGVRRHPDDPAAHRALGRYHLTRRPDLAVRHLERAIELDPDDDGARADRARAAVREAAGRMEAAFRRGDPAAVAQLYTDAGRLLPPDGGTVEGGAAIRAFWEDAMGTDPADLEVDTDEVYPGAGGDTATEVGRYRLIESGGPGAGGYFIRIWQRGPDGWKVHRDTWTQDGAP